MSSHLFSLEPLESRIAPALVINAGQTGNIAGETDYNDLTPADQFFVNTATNPADPISAVVGTGDATHPTFYLKLSKGDVLNVFDAGSGFKPFIKVDAGNVVAFFVDKDNNNEVSRDELTGLSLGKGVSISVSGSVDGDIVSNYNDASKDKTLWKLGGAAELLGTAQDLLLNPITKLTVGGSVSGNILSGGKITNVSVVGTVGQILAGTAANGITYDFTKQAISNNPDGGDTLVVAAPAKSIAGVAISTVTAGSVTKIQAGDAGAGAAGGSIANVTLLSDSDGLIIQAGAGGAGAIGKTVGGAGGGVTNILVKGLDSTTSDLSANSDIIIKSGAGGHSLGPVSGGKAGNISKVYVGFTTDPSTGKLKQSVNPLLDAVTVQAANGGGGKLGGAGGAVSDVHIFSAPTRTGNDIQVIGGDGGAADVVVLSGAKSGAGGAITTVEARNLNSLQQFALDAAGGTVAVTNGSTAVTGAGTSFDTEQIPGDPKTKLQPGDLVVIDGLPFHVVGPITATSFNLDSAFTGPTDAAAVATDVLLGSTVLVQAGSGGAVASPGTGGAGGAVTNAKLLGFDIKVAGGNGASASKSGGAGGALKTISIESLDDGSPAGIKARNVAIDAGFGGNASAGKGGTGGLITGVTVTNGDLVSFGINQNPGAAAGGTSGTGLGGAGGAVSKIDLAGIVDPANLGREGTAKIDAGDGANGSTGGGVGGAVSSVKVILQNSNVHVAGGTGGDATTSGKGGNGGGVSTIVIDDSGLTNRGAATAALANNLVDATATFITDGVQVGDVVKDTTTGTFATVVAVVSETQLTLDDDIFLAPGDTYGFPTKADIEGGVGGSGLVAGAGGKGGAILTTNLTLQGAVHVSSGNGGNGGPTGASGAGGAVSQTFESSIFGLVAIKAGDAGAVGGKAGAGGAITKASAAALTDISIIAGAGANGGAGGGLTTVGFTAPNTTEGNDGSVTLMAGAGSGAGTIAGAGGTISGANGFVGKSGTTLIQAGAGGAVATKAAAGGTVTNVNIYGGGGLGAIFNIEAGDASNSASAKTGGAGGNVKVVNVLALDPGTTFLHVAAGNGGNTGFATGKGGAGGMVDSVYVNYDIGVRSGQGFGFNTMGGIFSGSGGINTTVPGRTANTLDPKLDGVAGNVTNVTADAIASIVAGKPITASVITKQNLVTKVDKITLNTVSDPSHRTIVDGNGTFTNFNDVGVGMVGGVVNPLAVGVAFPAAHPHANTFDVGEFVDNDASTDFNIGDAINASTDGFIAAIALGSNRNFIPEALLTLTPAGASNFIDFTNGQATP